MVKSAKNLLVRSRTTTGESKDPRKALCFFSSLIMSMYEYDLNFLDVFFFLFSRSPESRGYPKDRRSKGFSRPKADIPRNWFLFYGGHVH